MSKLLERVIYMNNLQRLEMKVQNAELVQPQVIT